ncbi:MAG: hypothetical protein H5T86_13465, partial [Armatimonadetes bacterium]|nr:hypothetical protein [Armatimonadota bacterium]
MSTATGLLFAAALIASPLRNCALVVVPPLSLGMPVVVQIDFAEVARALGAKAEVKVGATDVKAAIVSAEGLKPVASQYDPMGPAQGELTLAMPASDTEQRVAVFFTADSPELAAPVLEQPLRVERRGNAVVVDNGFVRVTHDPARQGGLPSRWEFARSGKVFEHYNNNDRVWDKAGLGGFHLRNCPTPRVELTASGPLRAVVRVTAYYANAEGKRPPSAPEAVYEYSYFAGSPFVLLRAAISQRERFDWSELHVVEINFPGTDFTRWVVPGGEGPLAANKSSQRGAGWAALADDAGNVLAVLAPSCIIYDGRGEYGTYLHGPWVSWSTLENTFDVALYASSEPDALARLSGANAAQATPRSGRVSTPALEEALSRLRQVGRKGNKRWGWVAALIERMSQRRLADA